MNSEAAIYGRLSSDATLTALLASTTSIYPEVAPQNAANPCLVYSESTPEYADTKDGKSTLDTSIIQVDVYANTIAERNNIGSRVRVLLDRFSGTVNSVAVQSIQLVYSFKTYDQDSNAYRQTFDFRLRQVN
jgi:hypothetical protein